MQVIVEDLRALGYQFEWEKLDAQQFLLRQRRNRIFGTGDIDAGQNYEEYRNNMRDTMESMSSDALLAFESVFDQNLPEEPLEGRTYELLQAALEKACLESNSDNVFIDTSTSESRVNETGVESSTDVLTCVRPSHKIYSARLKRFVSPKELWNAQGLFKDNFENPKAVEDMLDKAAKARDLAGNAFPSTCMQAKLLASLVHSQGWKSLAQDLNAVSNSQNSNDSMNDSLDKTDTRSSSDHDSFITPSKSCSSDIDRSTLSSCSFNKSKKRSFSEASGNIVSSVEKPERLPAPKRRCFGKTKHADAMVPITCLGDIEVLRGNKRKKGPGRPKKNEQGHVGESIETHSVVPKDDEPRKRKYTMNATVARDGKKSCISIWAKMKLFEETRIHIFSDFFILYSQILQAYIM